MKRTVLALVVGTGLVGSPALLRADEVDSLGAKVTELDARVYELNQQLKPPSEPGPEIAERRLIDAQVLYELKNYESASIILFDVVEKYPQSQAYPEALFYLADSLYLKRDFLSSRRFFEKIVEVGPSTRRYQESLQRLIELSLHTGDYSPVDGYIAKLEGLAVDKQLPSVPYVKGKYYYFRRQFDKAIEALKVIGPTHIYYFHALYFVGAANVAAGPDKMEDALLAFGTILKTEAKTDSQKRITELTHMAMGRIYLERGQLTQALDEYAKIGQKSEHFNDMLYESAWVAIKGKDYVKARRQLDLLLLNAPESPLAPEVKLLTGSLHVRQNEFGPATDTFTKTRDEFDPIHRVLSEELTKTGDAPAHFRELIQRNLSRFDTAAILPPTVVRWVRDEPEIARVATLIGDEGDLKKSLDEAEEIVKRLERALSGPSRVNVFPELAAARTKGLEIQHELHDVRKALHDREAKLIAPVAGAQKAQLDQLEQEGNALKAKLQSAPQKQAGIQERQAKARLAYNELDKRASELTTETNGLKKSLDAARKMHQEAKRGGKLDPPAPFNTVVVPPEGDPGLQQPQGSHSDRAGQIDTRLKSAKTDVEKARARMDKLKDVVLKTPESARPEIDGCTADLETLDRQLTTIRHDILEAATTVGVDDSDMQAAAALRRQLEDTLKRQHAVVVEVQSRLSGSDRTKVEQVMSILDRMGSVDGKLNAFNARIDEFLDAKLKDISSALVDEKQHVVAYRETLSGYANESADVGGHVVADNFKTVATRFYNIVVRADVGIIDVAWALKDASTKETNRMVAERKRELKLLDDEFKEVLKESP